MDTMSRKLLNFSLLICLVIAVPGTMIFPITESFRFDDRAESRINPHTFTADWAAVEAIHITRAGESSLTSNRSIQIKIFMPAGIHASAAAYSEKTCCKVQINDNDSTTINNLPMKLLI